MSDFSQEFIQHLINGISLGSIYALIALGYTMVYGILQLINFAHSEVYMVGAFAAYYAARIADSKLGVHLAPGFATLVILIVVAMVVCSLLGLTIERLARDNQTMQGRTGLGFGLTKPGQGGCGVGLLGRCFGLGARSFGNAADRNVAGVLGLRDFHGGVDMAQVE